MTQEDKQLLLKDLCARIPYWIDLRIQYDGNDYTPFGYGAGRISMLSSPIMSCIVGYAPMVEEVRPYLRLMSSMTEEERKELKSVTCPNGTGYFNEQYLVCPVNHFGEQISFDFMSDIIDWLNEHHFDYRGLIEKGLALEAPDNMYKEG